MSIESPLTGYFRAQGQNYKMASKDEPHQRLPPGIITTTDKFSGSTRK